MRFRQISAASRFALVLLLLSSPEIQAETGATLAAGNIEFVGTNLVATANGSFERWRVLAALVNFENPGDTFVEVEVEIASLNTGIDMRDDHLRTADFFDVEKYPTARVRVDGVTSAGTGPEGSPRYAAQFHMRIRGVERVVPAEFDLVSASPPTVEGGFTLKRTDFGIGQAPSRWNPMSVDDDVVVRFKAVLPTPVR